jgi:hypothetical protein
LDVLSSLIVIVHLLNDKMVKDQLLLASLYDALWQMPLSGYRMMQTEIETLPSAESLTINLNTIHVFVWPYLCDRAIAWRVTLGSAIASNISDDSLASPEADIRNQLVSALQEESGTDLVRIEVGIMDDDRVCTPQIDANCADRLRA